MTREQYERTEEALVTAIERAETPEAVIKLTETLLAFQRNEPPGEAVIAILRGIFALNVINGFLLAVLIYQVAKARDESESTEPDAPQ